MEVDLKLSLGDEETAKKNDRDSSRSSTHSSLSPDHTDGLGSPEDYCQQVRNSAPTITLSLLLKRKRFSTLN